MGNFNGKEKREGVDDNSIIYADMWKDWTKIVVPGNKPTKNLKIRNKGHSGRMHKKNLASLKDKGCSVYEFSIVNDQTKYVVYIGRTCMQSCNRSSCSIMPNDHCSLKTRITTYARNGSHKSVEINNAVNRNFSLYVRYMPCKTIEDAQTRENEYLTKYDYAWNIQNNGPQRSLPLDEMMLQLPARS